MKKSALSLKKRIALLILLCILFTFAAPVNLLMKGTTEVFGANASAEAELSGYWAKETIKNWIEKGAIKGYEDGTFRPESNISRAEFISLVNGIFGYTEIGNANYKDVQAEDWYSNAMAKASAAGYISGYPDGTMKPDSPISREEVASVFMKINELTGNEASAVQFTDAGVLSWSKGCVGAVYSANIMTGYPDGSFQGKNNIKRGEAVVALDKAISQKLTSAEDAVLRNNYVALGDSIACGLSAAEGFGYADLFYRKLKTATGQEETAFMNLAKSGKNSRELLYELQQDKITMDAVSKSSVITISIGGNNILEPVVEDLAAAFNLNSKSDTFTSDLALALATKKNRDKAAAIMAGMSPKLTTGVEQFETDWAAIMKRIKVLAPQAEVYVMTIYNPLSETDILYNYFNNPISGINAVISSSSTTHKTVDVYAAFDNYKGADPLTNFNMLKGNLDIHPTTAGHETIYQSHLAQMQ